MNFKNSVITFIALVLFSCSSSKVMKQETKPKNVILLISDGTGLSQISSAFYFKESMPNYARFENIGLINTSSSSHDITDSAAGGTAFACGVKTYNDAIGVADDSTAVQNIVELVSLKKVNTGIIATSSITHATPASFYSHQISRKMNDEIALDLLNSEVDFFAAGGLQHFNDRKDKLNLLEALSNKDFRIWTNALGDFSQIKTSEKAGFLLGKNEMPKMLEGRGDFLPNAIELAIQYLNKDNSAFFIMAEGSQIDWGGHQNDSSYLISELLDFDNAVGKALDFAEKDGNTLVIVTSDHETGGFTLSAKKKIREDGSEYSDYREVGSSFSTGGHSATLIPVFAFGPGSEEFRGIYENNEIFEKIIKVTNWN